MYILIIMMFGMGGNAVATAEFNNLQACEATVQEVKKKDASASFTQKFCVPKGEVK
ncbi:hypothetical protein [Salmonella enterica]|uniref:hypothetical protein n=1 Tax=Salmonella enterica TaxID=28901 RepID=UPI0015E87778|nr:hypothetical protein [Salmonella enterica]